MGNCDSASPALTDAYTEKKKPNSIWLPCNRECTFLCSIRKLEVSNSTQEPVNKDAPSALPKQLPRCERKVLQAVAMASSAETTVLIIRSSTLAISAARRGGKKKKKKKKVDCEVAHSI